MLFRFTLGLALLSSTPAFAIGSGRIVAPSSEIAHTTVLIVSELGAYCSGTLISPTLVLTAGHCVTNPFATERTQKPSSLDVYFGNFDGETWNPSLTRKVSALERHPDYFGVDFHDLAILKLDSPAPESFHPARLLLDPSKILPRMRITLAGFGRTLEDGDLAEPDSRILRSFETKVKFPINAYGQIQLYQSKYLPWNWIRYLSESGDARRDLSVSGMMSGDSGGPAILMLNGSLYVAGVASGYSIPGDEPAYENVPTHAAWILATMSALR